MAESTLSLAWADLKSEVGFFLGYGRTVANFTTAQDAEVELLIHAGVRRVFFPPAMQGVEAGYEWSWLRPTTTLYLGAAGTDGVIASTTSFTSATFTNFETIGITTDDYVSVSDAGSSSVTVGEYSIASVSGATITLDNPSTRTGTPTPLDGTGLTFRITRDAANYTLPDGVKRIIGDLHYATAEYRPGITVVSVSQILEMRAGYDRTGYAEFAAIRYKTSDQTDGQRQEILFYPRPDAFRILSYEYEVLQGSLTDAANYPLGGMALSELYVESCLAVAEQRSNDEIGLHNQIFQTLLADAIERDRKQSAQNYGAMGDTEISDLRRFRRGLTGASYSYSYDGTRIL